jgi:peptidoglycan/xylan/chitin deacetylase (PgdA/CDA1 family)
MGRSDDGVGPATSRRQELAAAGTATAAPTQTVVSLTFDDGTATQYVARLLFASHAMHGTFYINSSRLGAGISPGALALRPVSALRSRSAAAPRKPVL